MPTFNLWPGGHTAGEPLSQYQAVYIDGGEVKVASNATTHNVIGVVLQDYATGERPQVATTGARTWVKLAAGQNPDAGVDLAVAANGTATATIADKNRRFARTLAKASAAGGMAWVEILDSSTQRV